MTGTALKYRKPRRIYGTLCWVHTPTFWKIRLLEMTVFNPEIMREESEQRQRVSHKLKLCPEEYLPIIEGGNDRDLTVTETGEIQQRCRELLEKCREP